MRNIATKIAGSTLGPSDYNANETELENAVTTTDDTLDSPGEPGSDTDLFMLSKAMAAYAGAAWAYTDSGTANAHVLSIASNMKPPIKYFDNMMVAYIPGNVNTTTSVTVNVASLGAKVIAKPDGTNPGVGNLGPERAVILQYSLSDGWFIIVSGLVLPSIIASSKNLVIINGSTPDEEVDINADEVILQSVNGTPRRIKSVNFTADNTASGQNGLFTGSVAADALYAIWLTSGTSGTTSGLHLSADLATVLGDAPSGFDDYGAHMGWIPTDGTSDFYLIEQRGRLVSVIDTQFLTAGTSATFAAVDLSALVPSTAIAVMGYGRVTGNTAGASLTLFISPNNSTVGQLLINTTIASAGHAHISPFRLVGISGQELYYKVAAGAGLVDADINISGWEY